MQLQKPAAGTVGGKSAPAVRPETSVGKDGVSKTPSSRAAKVPVSSAPLQAAPSRSVSSLVSAAGLPQDKLSASIVSFARFFSLPLKPEMLAEIRRHAFASPSAARQAAETQGASPPDAVKHAADENVSDAGAAAKNRQALSLAAAAAESKGAELESEALEKFAEAIDPDWRRRQDGERQRRNKNRGGKKEENAPSKTAPVTAAGLKELVLQTALQTPFATAEENSLLEIMNRLPGKNGQRWIVLPFNFCEDGREFNVSMRILLEPQRISGNAVCMALDISESGESERRWLFMLESAKDRAMRLTVCVQPELSLNSHDDFTRDLSCILDIPIRRISVKDFPDDFPCESGRGSELLCAIDEAV
jgi:hypothetical protein